MNILVKKVFLKTSQGLADWIGNHNLVQVVSPEVVAGPTHAKHSVLEVLKAFEQQNNISRSPEMELLVRLSGERQVSRALEKARVKGDEAVFICWNEDCSRTWEEFKKEFVKKEVLFTDPDKSILLEAMEKTAVFWMRS